MKIPFKYLFEFADARLKREILKSEMSNFIKCRLIYDHGQFLF